MDKKKIIALLVFIILGLFIFSFANYDPDTEFVDDGGTTQTDTSDYDKAKKAVELAEDTLIITDVDKAQELVDKLEDGKGKDELNDRLDEVRDQIAFELALEALKQAIANGNNVIATTTTDDATLNGLLTQLRNAITDGQAIVDNPDGKTTEEVQATTDRINNLINQINARKAELERQAQEQREKEAEEARQTAYQQLHDLLLKAYDEDLYEADSYNDLEAAMNAGASVATNASKEIIDAAIKAINDADEALVDATITQLLLATDHALSFEREASVVISDYVILTGVYNNRNQTTKVITSYTTTFNTAQALGTYSFTASAEALTSNALSYELTKNDEDRLNDAKEDAIKEIEDKLQELLEENEYSNEKEEELKQIAEDGINDIKDATDIDDVEDIKDQAIEDMENVPTKEEEYQQQLELDKTAAIQAIIDAYNTYDEDDYSVENWEVLTNIKDQGIENVNNATTNEAVETARDNAIDGMANVPSLEEEYAEQLALDKEAAIQAIIDAYNTYDKDDYSVENWEALTNIKDQGIENVNNATTNEAVETARDDAIDGMANVKTIEQQNNEQEEEALRLEMEALIAKIAEGNGYLTNGNSYTADSRNALINAINDGQAIVDSYNASAYTGTQADVTTAKNNINTAILGLQLDTEVGTGDFEANDYPFNVSIDSVKLSGFFQYSRDIKLTIADGYTITKVMYDRGDGGYRTAEYFQSGNGITVTNHDGKTVSFTVKESIWVRFTVYVEYTYVEDGQVKTGYKLYKTFLSIFTA